MDQIDQERVALARLLEQFPATKRLSPPTELLSLKKNYQELMELLQNEEKLCREITKNNIIKNRGGYEKE
jgi:hypothetical protein